MTEYRILAETLQGAANAAANMERELDESRAEVTRLRERESEVERLAEVALEIAYGAGTPGRIKALKRYAKRLYGADVTEDREPNDDDILAGHMARRPALHIIDGRPVLHFPTNSGDAA